MISLRRYGLVGALVISFSVSFATGDPGGAIAALNNFANSPHLAADEVILGAVGFYGEPQPPQWLILTTVSGREGVLRESVFSRGKVTVERKFSILPGQDLPSLPIDLKTLKVDSGKAFLKAEEIAAAKKIAFDTAHYQLRCREAGREPVWMISLMNRSQVSVGVLYFSATSGLLLKETWPQLKIEKFASPDFPR